MKAQVIGPRLLRTMPLPAYDEAASKDERGKLLVVAGSEQLPGGAILPAKAALRVGCGTVRVSLPRSLAAAVGVAVPELMIVGREAISEQLASCVGSWPAPGWSRMPSRIDCWTG